MKPAREPATDNRQTYFVSSQTWGRRRLFQIDRWARLFLETLYHYRGSAYLLHEFVIMPDHFHALLTPRTSLKRAMQFIKGGFSRRAKVAFGSNLEIWQRGFSERRIRDAADFHRHLEYIYQNPVAKRLAAEPQDYPYSSARAEFPRDPVPQRLKPFVIEASNGTAKAVPLQRIDRKERVGSCQEARSSNSERLLKGGRNIEAVILVGYMGAGKTSVGQALASRLGWRFVDLDDRIQSREGRSIAEIFRDSGERAFRAAESRALGELLAELPSAGGTVAALGGGAFAQEENAAAIRRSGHAVVFLDAEIGELRRRCAQAGAARPLYQDENQFRQLYERRLGAYMKADFCVDTTGKSIAQVALEIASILQGEGSNDVSQ